MQVTPITFPSFPRQRGVVRALTRQQAIERALSALSQVPDPPDPDVSDAGRRPIAYRLDPGFNGGFDPFASHCASWSYGGRTPTSDCIGFLLWSSGIDRDQPQYHGVEGPWLNCVSLIADADGDRVFCESVDHDKAQAGDWLLTADHCAMIIRPAIFGNATAMRFDHLVIDCSPRHGRDTAVGLGLPWSHACRVLRYKHYVSVGGSTSGTASVSASTSS
jgi:hypothetical protein